MCNKPEWEAHTTVTLESRSSAWVKFCAAFTGAGITERALKSWNQSADDAALLRSEAVAFADKMMISYCDRFEDNGMPKE